VTTTLADAGLRQLSTQAHPHCVMCSHANECGLQLEFNASDDAEVAATFDCDARFEGYTGVLHGGIIASLMDSAMTNCLFAEGIPAVTVGLTIRFRHPVVTGFTATVRAWIERSAPPRHVLRAEIVQDGQVKASAEGRFLGQPQLIPGGAVRTRGWESKIRK